MTFAEIGKELGVSSQRAEQIYKGALVKLRGSETLRNHVDFAPREPRIRLNWKPKGAGKCTVGRCNRGRRGFSTPYCDGHYRQMKKYGKTSPLRVYRKAMRVPNYGMPQEIRA